MRKKILMSLLILVLFACSSSTTTREPAHVEDQEKSFDADSLEYQQVLPPMLNSYLQMERLKR